MRLNWRSVIFQRVFWGAFLAAVLTILAARWNGRFSVLAATAALAAFVAAWLLAWPVDRRLSRLREFAAGLLKDKAPAGAALDELEELDRSLRRMAEQVRALLERASVESAEREAILASMREGVLAVDAQLRVTFCNRALAEFAGARMPAPGTPSIELLRDAELQETLGTVIRTGEPATRHLQIPAAYGRSFEVYAAPLVSAHTAGAIAILHDITDLERLDKVRTDFVANVSHEFRTPLTAIAGYAETLLDGALEDPENNRRFLEIIRSNANRLNSIASDLLTLSELQTGAATQDNEQIPLRAAIDSALSTIAAEAASRGVTLERGTVDDVAVSGSRYRLEQALVNLMANAVKFNHSGGQVHVETERNGAEIRIRIADTGTGIPSTDLPRIFERFYRVDKARSRQVGGTGLGLSIVKHIVERMNGHVSAASQLGKGSVFTVTLPLP